DYKQSHSTETKTEVVPDSNIGADDHFAEVEKYVEESAGKDLPSSETNPQSSSILNWLTSSSSIFSNLSLANVMGAKTAEKLEAKSAEKVPDPIAPPSAVNTRKVVLPQALPPKALEKTPVFDDTAPPGFNIEPSIAGNLLSGPPPGFEGTHPDDAPPGLSLPTTSRPLFSMAPFISHADINTNKNGTFEESRTEDCEWMKVGGK
ncbi:hypothetical protein COOONC_01579, partial [Cooperia oncophora]